MNQHTPGPWEWDGTPWDYDSENESPWLVQHPWQSRTSATVLRGKVSCSEANARLIAAAPDLLEALLDCRRALEVHNCKGELAVVDAAIAKATGAQQ